MHNPQKNHEQMYITCQKCSTSFVVKPDQIGTKGRRVRCSKCRHMWYVDPIIAPKTRKAITPTAELLRPLTADVHLPVIMPQEARRPSSDWIIILVMFLIFSFAIFFSKSVDFDFINKPSDDLIISEVKVYHAKDTNKMTLRYKVTNDGKQAAPIPHLRIKLFDSANKLIQTYEMTGAVAEVEPLAAIKLRTEFDGIPENAETIEVTIGSKLDFLFR